MNLHFTKVKHYQRTRKKVVKKKDPSVFWRVGKTLNSVYFFDNDHEATYLCKHSFSRKETHSVAEQMLESQTRKDGPAPATVESSAAFKTTQEDKYPKAGALTASELIPFCSSSLIKVELGFWETQRPTFS